MPRSYACVPICQSSRIRFSSVGKINVLPTYSTNYARSPLVAPKFMQSHWMVIRRPRIMDVETVSEPVLIIRNQIAHRIKEAMSAEKDRRSMRLRLLRVERERCAAYRAEKRY